MNIYKRYMKYIDVMYVFNNNSAMITAMDFKPQTR